MFIDTINESLVNFGEDHNNFALLLIWDKIVVRNLLVKLEGLRSTQGHMRKSEILILPESQFACHSIHLQSNP